ncbi:histidine kinase dimerization/phosphoacceptor domain -containing protein [Paraflavitalea sp. CAU 1676]|uniref:tetratricopeptide repeat-containing sensor histidine kinase n=1 Tax=Paraflavitalea sp. CAU 1676 TaxID=3032598 RepID=UPI0023DB5CC8|nr:histidine kinase dimerization/phosphoacceptor domain -containing protein [Paraflavitalea sp. CAU 1676]MDF2191403.1 histidine kinase dimerization/phosphoacceptor domain -containing protein [Paraflavitalea sp. CAU 1676]
MLKLTLLMAVAFCCTTVYAQHVLGEKFVHPDSLPSLKTQLNNIHPNTPKAPLLLDIGYAYLYRMGEFKNDLDSGLYYAREVATLGKQTNNARDQQEALLLTALLHMERKDFPAAESLMPAMHDTIRLKLLLSLVFFNETAAFENPFDTIPLVRASRYLPDAVDLSLKTNLLHEEASNALDLIARQYREHHQPAVAEKYYLLMEKFMSPTSHGTQALIYAFICFAYSKDGNFHRAMEYALKAKKALTNKSSDDDVAYVYFATANLHNLRDKPEEALPQYAFLLANPARFNKRINMYSLLATYCANLQKAKRQHEIIPYLQQFVQRFPTKADIDRSYYHLALANYYKEQNQFDLAEKNFLAGIRFDTDNRIPNAQLQAGLGSLYFDHHMYAKAKDMLQAAEDKLPNENNVLKARNLFNMARTEAALGHHENAYTYLLKSKSMSDSVFTVGKARLTDELEAQYESRKKEADLLQKEANIRDLNARRKINSLITILMTVIVALLGWLFWTKLKSNKLITQKNTLLQQLVKDKSWLLKEMHHRVKNNLHTIVSLLESQSAYLHDDALEAIQHSQARIFSMSLIHQKLYQSDDTKTIDMATYIPELVDYLKESFNRSVHIHMDIDNTAFNVEEAVPIGLIINEAVTNSMKYGFREGNLGEIWIILKETGNDEYQLTLADNGCGLRQDFDLETTTTLGFQLIKGLSEQLNATLHIENNNGLKITLSRISAFWMHQLKVVENEMKEQMAM